MWIVTLVKLSDSVYYIVTVRYEHVHCTHLFFCEVLFAQRNSDTVILP